MQSHVWPETTQGASLLPSMGGCPLYKVWINSYKTETQVLHAPYITASIFQTHVLWLHVFKIIVQKRRWKWNKLSSQRDLTDIFFATGEHPPALVYGQPNPLLHYNYFEGIYSRNRYSCFDSSSLWCISLILLQLPVDLLKFYCRLSKTAVCIYYWATGSTSMKMGPNVL